MESFRDTVCLARKCLDGEIKIFLGFFRVKSRQKRKRKKCDCKKMNTRGSFLTVTVKHEPGTEFEKSKSNSY